MSSEKELLQELQRLHRRGLINDEEAVQLRRLLNGKSVRKRQPQVPPMPPTKKITNDG